MGWPHHAGGWTQGAEQLGQPCIWIGRQVGPDPGAMEPQAGKANHNQRAIGEAGSLQQVEFAA